MKTILCLLVLLCLALPARAAARYVPLDLSSVFDNDGVATADNPRDGNFDAIGTTQPATFNFAADGFPQGPEATLSGIPFRIGSIAPGAKNNAVAQGQTVPAPAGRYSALYVLAACTNGTYTGTWTLRYGDGPAQTTPLRFSDWCQPPGPGEAVAVRTPFRYLVDGGKSPDAEPQLFVQRVLLDANRSLASITLPSQLNTHVFALTLSEGEAPEPVSLPPVKKAEETGPRITIRSDAADGLLVVPPGSVRLSVTADRLPPNAKRIRILVTLSVEAGAKGRAVVAESGVAGSSVTHNIPLGNLSPGYYPIEVRITGDGPETVFTSGLAVVPDDRKPEWKPDSPFGINEGFADENAAVAARHARLARLAGIRWVRQGFGWSVVEPEPGKWDWTTADRAVKIAASEKIFTLGLLAYWAGWSKPFTPEGYSAYADYAGKLVSRYKDVPVFEVWNEPNIFYWKGTRDQYAELLKTATDAIHRANPKAKAAGMATAFSDVPFIKGVLSAGANPDIVSFHPYRGGYPDVPSKLAQFDGGISPHTMAEEARGVKDATGERPIWYTEVGWWTGDPAKGGHTEQFQANALVRAYVTALSEGVQRVFSYAFVDAGPNPDFSEHHFGILRLDLSPKPAYAAYTTMTRFLEGAKYVGTADASPRVQAFRFRRGDETITVFWATEGMGGINLIVAGKATLYTWDGRSIPLPAAQPRWELPADESPAYLVEAPAR